MNRCLSLPAALVFLLSVFLPSLFVQTASARGFRVNQLPNGSVNGCLSCHVGSGGAAECLWPRNREWFSERSGK